MRVWNWLQEQRRVKQVWTSWKKTGKKSNKQKTKRTKRYPSGLFGIQYKVCFDFKKEFVNKSPQEKLDRLIQFSKLKFKNHSPYKKRRKHSHRVKSYWRCWVCKSKAELSHHIIQVQNGGYDNGINRVGICVTCHEKIHEWMIGNRIERLNSDMDGEVNQICKQSV